MGACWAEGRGDMGSEQGNGYIDLVGTAIQTLHETRPLLDSHNSARLVLRPARRHPQHPGLQPRLHARSIDCPRQPHRTLELRVYAVEPLQRNRVRRRPTAHRRTLCFSYTSFVNWLSIPRDGVLTDPAALAPTRPAPLPSPPFCPQW